MRQRSGIRAPTSEKLVKDIDQLHVLRPGRDPKLSVGPKEEAHILAHSMALLDWLEGRYGADTFSVGGPFQIANSKLKPLHRFQLAGLLEENGVAPRQLLKMLFSKGGFGFVANRHEELLAIARAGSFRVGYRF
jgi:hypothetical protein